MEEPLSDFSAFPEEERLRLVKLVRRWGSATTDAVLNPAMRIFQHPSFEGFISYRQESQCLIVFGDPISAETDRAPLAEAFHLFAENLGKSVIYIAASASFARWAIQQVCNTLIECIEELVFDPSCDPRKYGGDHASLVRRKVKQAVHEGVVVREYLTGDAHVEEAIEQVKERWLRARRGPQFHISNVYPFSDRFGKRWFYAQQGDQAIGVVFLNQLQAQEGWLLNHLMVVPEAPHGTSELLVTSAFEALGKEGCRFATVGVVPARAIGEIVGLNPIFCWILRQVFKLIKNAAHLGGLNTFWNKFHPQKKPSYLLFSQKQIGLRTLISLRRILDQKQ